jgi:hypothetical protein
MTFHHEDEQVLAERSGGRADDISVVSPADKHDDDSPTVGRGGETLDGAPAGSGGEQDVSSVDGSVLAESDENVFRVEKVVGHRIGRFGDDGSGMCPFVVDEYKIKYVDAPLKDAEWRCREDIDADEVLDGYHEANASAIARRRANFPLQVRDFDYEAPPEADGAEVAIQRLVAAVSGDGPGAFKAGASDRFGCDADCSFVPRFHCALRAYKARLLSTLGQSVRVSSSRVEGLTRAVGRYHRACVAALQASVDDDPLTYADVMRSINVKAWQTAMALELEIFDKFGVYELVSRPTL